MINKGKPLNLTSYHSKIVGVTFEGRQEVIARLKGDEQLRFRREPENEYDPNAVAIDVYGFIDGNGRPNSKSWDDNGEHGIHREWSPIGYIARDKNAELAQVLTDNRFASIKMSDITGGGDKAFIHRVRARAQTNSFSQRGLGKRFLW